MRFGVPDESVTSPSERGDRPKIPDILSPGTNFFATGVRGGLPEILGDFGVFGVLGDLSGLVPDT